MLIQLSRSNKHATIAILTVYKQVFWYLNFANHRTKESFVSTANKPLVGTLMTIGDVTVSIAIVHSCYLWLFCQIQFLISFHVCYLSLFDIILKIQM